MQICCRLVLCPRAHARSLREGLQLDAFFKKMPSRLESGFCTMLGLSSKSFPVSLCISIEVSLSVRHDQLVWRASPASDRGWTDVLLVGPRSELSDRAARSPQSSQKHSGAPKSPRRALGRRLRRPTSVEIKQSEDNRKRQCQHSNGIVRGSCGLRIVRDGVCLWRW